MHLINLSTNDTIRADATLDQQNEQLFLDLGISVNMKSIYYPVPRSWVKNRMAATWYPFMKYSPQTTGCSSHRLLMLTAPFAGWVAWKTTMFPRSAELDQGRYLPERRYSDWNMPNKPYDPNQNYEKIINGTWAPYVLCSANDQDNVGPVII